MPRVVAMAIVSAVGIAVIYLPQPIQLLVAEEFGIPVDASAGAAVAIQAGYALGILLLVPLGDRFAARRQVPVQLGVTALAIVGAGLAQAWLAFVALCFIAGATTIVAQLLVASALRVAPPAVRARTAAVLSGSFILGLFVVRVVMGAAAESFGWRPVLIACAVVVLACIPLALVAPHEAPAAPPPYGRLLASIPGIARRSPTLVLMTLAHASAFAAFITVWSSMTVIAVTRLGLTTAEAALLGLAGLAAGATTIALAPLHAVVGARRAWLGSLALLLAGAVFHVFGSTVLPIVVAGLYLLSVGLSSSQVSTQATALASVDPSASGRANTVFMTTTFFIGAAATALAELALASGGPVAVGAMATAFSLMSCTVWVIARRRLPAARRVRG